MIDYLLLLLPIVLPVVFWSAYHLHVDRHLPEPPAKLVLAFLLGVGSFFLGMLAYRALGLLGLRYNAFALGQGRGHHEVFRAGDGGDVEGVVGAFEPRGLRGAGWRSPRAAFPSRRETTAPPTQPATAAAAEPAPAAPADPGER